MRVSEHGFEDIDGLAMHPVKLAVHRLYFGKF